MNRLCALLSGAALLAALLLAVHFGQSRQRSSSVASFAEGPAVDLSAPVPPIPEHSPAAVEQSSLMSSAVIEEAARLAALGESTGRQAAITAFVAGLSNPGECASLATNLTRYGHSLAGAALRRWVELDPVGAIRQFGLATPQRDLRAANLAWMFRDYSEQDPAAALAFAKSLPENRASERNLSIAATLPALAKIDPQVAAEELRFLPASIGASAAAEVYAEVARYQPATNAFSATGDLSGTAHVLAKQAVLKFTAARNPQEAVALWHGVRDAGLRHDLTRALADSFRANGTHPQATAKWLLDHAPERGTESVRAEAIAHLALQDPASAQALIASRPAGERDDLQAAVASMIDPQAGLAFAKQIGRDEQRQTVLAEVALRMAASDPIQLYAQAEQDPAFAQAALPAVVDALAYDDFSKATKYVVGLPENQRDGPAARLVERIADTDPERAMNLAAELISDDDTRRQTVASAFAEVLARRSPTGGQALPTLPAGVDGDSLLSSVVPLVAFRNPEAAWAVANAIGNDALRINAFQEALMGVQQTQSANAAEAWLALAGLPETATEQIRQALRLNR